MHLSSIQVIKAYGVFVMKLPENIQRMNMCFKEIKDLFASAGIDDFSRLPSDPTERQKFSKLFRELNKYLEPAKVQALYGISLHMRLKTQME